MIVADATPDVNLYWILIPFSFYFYLNLIQVNIIFITITLGLMYICIFLHDIPSYLHPYFQNARRAGSCLWSGPSCIFLQLVRYKKSTLSNLTEIIDIETLINNYFEIQKTAIKSFDELDTW